MVEQNAHLGVFDADRIARIAAETQRRSKVRKDYVAPRSKIGFTLTDTGAPALTIANGSTHTWPIKRTALHQVAGSINMPITFVDRLFAKGHSDLVVATVSELLNREDTTEAGKPRKHLVRELDGQVDAFLSDSYRAIPNDAILAVALQAFEEAGAQVWDLRLTDTEFSVLAAAPHISGKVTTDRKFSGMSRWEGKEGDVLNAALKLGNSETGHSRLKAQSAILRRVCQNFNIWADVVAKTHLGRKLSEGEINLSDETRALEDKALISAIKDAIKTTFDPITFKATLDRINQTTTRELGESPILVVDASIKVFGLDESRKDLILEKLLRSGDKSQYGLTQAITAQVNPENAKTLDDATRNAFEEAGGKVLAMGEREWKAFLANAYAPRKGEETQAQVQTVSVRS